MPETSPLNLAIAQIEFARQYTVGLIESIDESDYFVIPAGGVTHIAWQLGHLAMAEYALTMMRIRGKEPDDANLIDNDFLRAFKKGSRPIADATAYPDVAHIRQVFDGVHEHALREMPTYGEDLLRESLPEPYMAFANKLGSLLFCAAHEMMHAGQIGTWRRMMGMAPVR